MKILLLLVSVFISSSVYAKSCFVLSESAKSKKIETLFHIKVTVPVDLICITQGEGNSIHGYYALTMSFVSKKSDVKFVTLARLRGAVKPGDCRSLGITDPNLLCMASEYNTGETINSILQKIPFSYPAISVVSLFNKNPANYGSGSYQFKLGQKTESFDYTSVYDVPRKHFEEPVQ